MSPHSLAFSVEVTLFPRADLLTHRPEANILSRWVDRSGSWLIGQTFQRSIMRVLNMRWTARLTPRLCACYTSPFLLSSGHLEAGRHPESCSSTAAQRRYGCSSANESPPAHMEPGGQLAFCSLALTDAGPTHLLSGHIFARVSFSPSRPFTPFKGALSSRQKPRLHLALPFTLCCDFVHSAVAGPSL